MKYYLDVKNLNYILISNGGFMENKEEIRRENIKIRRVRLLVDFTCSILAQTELSAVEMLHLVENTKMRVLDLFPDKESTYNLIYKPRFERIIRQRLNSN